MKLWDAQAIMGEIRIREQKCSFPYTWAFKKYKLLCVTFVYYFNFMCIML